MRRISVDLRRVLELEEVGLLLGADAVLARDRAAEVHAGGEQLEHQLLRTRILLEHGEVHVAVTGVAAAGDPCAVASPMLATAAMNSGIGAGHDDVDDVVGAVRLGDPERLLARVDQLRRRVRRQDVDVDGAELDEELGQRLDVLVEPVVVVALDADDEVGEGGP